VINQQGVELGAVARLMETGANDVLVVKGERERLIPYVKDIYVKSVDVQAGEIHVDWDADF
jgi:16S rRNA processing protein RimM